MVGKGKDGKEGKRGAGKAGHTSQASKRSKPSASRTSLGGVGGRRGGVPAGVDRVVWQALGEAADALRSHISKKRVELSRDIAEDERVRREGEVVHRSVYVLIIN